MEKIQLVIRTTNNKYEDLIIEISSTLTVYDLKENITLNHSTKPIPTDQRLIYSGKLLEDKQPLSQIFITTISESSSIVHLVLNSDKNESTSNLSQQSTITSSISSHSAAYEHYMNELNRYQQCLLNRYEISSISNSETQIYFQYCHTYYQMYQNYLVQQRPTISTNSSTPSAANNNEVDQANNLFRTLLILIELFILCSFIYFNINFYQFLLICIIFIFLYLNYRGYFLIQQHQQVLPGIEQAAEVNPEQNEQSSPQSEPVVDNSISLTRVFLTFFSSLIPEGAQRN